MPFYIAHVTGPPSSKRVLTDSGDFATAQDAEDAARSQWPDGDYFIVEADDADRAGIAAIAESRTLD